MEQSFEAEVRSFLSPGGGLSRLIRHYEHRPEQEAMAGGVLRCLAEGSILLVEAGTGTGKTLAYLVPALYAGERVLISTGTKALQEQLMNKDLPILARHFEIKAALMKGRTNYLCKRRFQEFARNPMFQFADEISRIEKWADRTHTGDRSEIPGLPDDCSMWRELTSSSEQCHGQKCACFRECFITRMRAQAQAADIVVVNHHLFFADLAVRGGPGGQVLPSYTTVIFDEAHSLPEVATEFFGTQVSHWRLEDFSKDLRRNRRLGCLPADELQVLLRALEKAEVSMSALMKTIMEARRDCRTESEGPRFSLETILGRGEVKKQGEKAIADFGVLSHHLAEAAREENDLSPLAEQARAFSDDLSFLLRPADPDHVFWGEIRGRGLILRASPVDLGPLLGSTLFARPHPLIFTSATLAVRETKGWSFSHFRRSLGLDDCGRACEELNLPSSYNWQEQAMLYVPADLPDPGRADFISRAVEEMEKILEISAGRAFVLFTSYRNLETAYKLLAPRLSFPLLKQGEGPKSELLECFRKQRGSVLFATSSFWEGVDVAGQALTAVIIDKLPFDSPADPLASAKINRIRQGGGDPFHQYQVPAAVLALKQGLGRLLRSRTDYGILAVLDSRLHTRRYGRIFLQSLPPIPLSTDLAQIRRFLQSHEDKRSG